MLRAGRTGGMNPKRSAVAQNRFIYGGSMNDQLEANKSIVRELTSPLTNASPRKRLPNISDRIIASTIPAQEMAPNLLLLL